MFFCYVYSPKVGELRFLRIFFRAVFWGLLDELVDDDLCCYNYDMLDNKFHRASHSFQIIRWFMFFCYIYSPKSVELRFLRNFFQTVYLCHLRSFLMIRLAVFAVMAASTSLVIGIIAFTALSDLTSAYGLLLYIQSEKREIKIFAEFFSDCIFVSLKELFDDASCCFGCDGCEYKPCDRYHSFHRPFSY